jgi:hypothetical protein
MHTAAVILALALFSAPAFGLTGDRCEDVAPGDCHPEDVCNAAGAIQVQHPF